MSDIIILIAIEAHSESQLDLHKQLLFVWDEKLTQYCQMSSKSTTTTFYDVPIFPKETLKCFAYKEEVYRST